MAYGIFLQAYKRGGLLKMKTNGAVTQLKATLIEVRVSTSFTTSPILLHFPRNGECCRLKKTVISALICWTVNMSEETVVRCYTVRNRS